MKHVSSKILQIIDTGISKSTYVPKSTSHSHPRRKEVEMPTLLECEEKDIKKKEEEVILISPFIMKS